jgi:hypothetical protein
LAVALRASAPRGDSGSRLSTLLLEASSRLGGAEPGRGISISAADGFIHANTMPGWHRRLPRCAHQIFAQWGVQYRDLGSRRRAADAKRAWMVAGLSATPPVIASDALAPNGE